jgi:hypothetical protein
MKPTKRQIIDNSLFLYGGLVAFTLTGIAFFNLNNLTSVIALVLFFPVSVYFLIRLLLSLVRLINKGLSIDQKRQPYFGEFSLKTFLNQTETTFLINQTLLALAISLILFRISLYILK